MKRRILLLFYLPFMFIFACSNNKEEDMQIPDDVAAISLDVFWKAEEAGTFVVRTEYISTLNSSITWFDEGDVADYGKLQSKNNNEYTFSREGHLILTIKQMDNYTYQVIFDVNAHLHVARVSIGWTPTNKTLASYGFHSMDIKYKDGKWTPKTESLPWSLLEEE